MSPATVVVICSGIIFSSLIFGYSLFSSESMKQNLRPVKKSVPNKGKWADSYQSNTTTATVQRNLEKEARSSSLSKKTTLLKTHDKSSSLSQEKPFLTSVQRKVNRAEGNNSSLKPEKTFLGRNVSSSRLTLEKKLLDSPEKNEGNSSLSQEKEFLASLENPQVFLNRPDGKDTSFFWFGRILRCASVSKFPSSLSNQVGLTP